MNLCWLDKPAGVASHTRFSEGLISVLLSFSQKSRPVWNHINSKEDEGRRSAFLIWTIFWLQNTWLSFSTGRFRCHRARLVPPWGQCYNISCTLLFPCAIVLFSPCFPTQCECFAAPVSEPLYQWVPHVHTVTCAVAAADVWRRWTTLTLQPNRSDWRRCGAAVGGRNIYSRHLPTNKQERDAAAVLTLNCRIWEEPNFEWGCDPDVLSSTSSNRYFFCFFQEKTWECYRFNLNVCNPQTSDLEPLIIFFPRYKSGSQIFTDQLPGRHYTGAPTRCCRRNIWKYFLLNPNGLSWLPVPTPLKPDSFSDIIYSTLPLVAIISACMYKLCRLRFCIWNGLLKHCMQIPGDLCFVSTGWITHLFTGDMCV